MPSYMVHVHWWTTTNSGTVQKRFKYGNVLVNCWYQIPISFKQHRTDKHSWITQIARALLATELRRQFSAYQRPSTTMSSIRLSPEAMLIIRQDAHLLVEPGETASLKLKNRCSHYVSRNRWSCVKLYSRLKYTTLSQQDVFYALLCSM